MTLVLTTFLVTIFIFHTCILEIFLFGPLKGDNFGIDDADITIWRGVERVVDLGLEECQGSHQGYGVLPGISLLSRCS
jgi:hypothetical protein